MGNDGLKELKPKRCPFLNGDCIGTECALYIEMKRVSLGLKQTFGMCGFTAMVQILSEMNLKAQSPQQKIEIPKLMRG